jgi:putative pyruvate formate lyase activating enzyme
MNDAEPLYLQRDRAEIERRAATLRRWSSPCRLCPRGCNVLRADGETGFCGVGMEPRIASAGAHFGEEPELVGRHGSGTIFFSGCNLGCVYCQNWPISLGREGEIVDATMLAERMLALQGQGCHNINLVTPTHQAPAILEALVHAREGGLRIPLVWNSGGYERADVLAQLDGIVDIYMPDLKYGEDPLGSRLSCVDDYVSRSRSAVREMYRQVGTLTVRDGVAVRGLIVRHLVLPGTDASTAEVLRFIAEELSTETYVNLMDQYRPMHRAMEHGALARRLDPAEFERAVQRARRHGLHRGLPQR